MKALNPPERILHRANVVERILAGIDNHFDRLEVDLWYAHGEFRLCHDRQFAGLVLGRNGVALSDGRFIPLWRTRSFVSLPGVFTSAPLYIDLKGRWGKPELTQLANILSSPERVNDYVTSHNWRHLDCYRAIDSRRKLVFNDGLREMGKPLLQRLRRGEWIFGTSLRASMFFVYPRVMYTLRHATACFGIGGMRIFLWDVPDVATYERLKRENVGGLIIDDPSWK